MAFFRDAAAIIRSELTLVRRFSKLRVAAVGIIVIPALYALIYLYSVRDPGAHTGELKAAIVNLDRGMDYHGQSVNMGQDVASLLKEKRTFGFVDVAVEEDAKREVRLGRLAFALIIPKDFSANAVPGNEAAGGRLVMYVSEGNNYNGANLAKRFAAELGHQVNINLNEKRWSLVLSKATGSLDKLTELRRGVQAIRDGSHRVNEGLARAEAGSKALAVAADGLSDGVGQLTEGVKQLGAGLRTMDQQRPSAQDLAALNSGVAELATGRAGLDQGLLGLQGGAQKLATGAGELRDDTQSIPIVGGRISKASGQLAEGARQLGVGLQVAKIGNAQLADGTERLGNGVAKLTDAVAVGGAGIHTTANKLPADAKLDELAAGGHSLAASAQDLRSGLAHLQAGSQELASGIDLLNRNLPADIIGPGGSARGLADSVEPAMEIVAPVPNNGAGFAPNFLATSLWMGAVLSAFLMRLRQLPKSAGHASRPARLAGKLGIPAAIVVAQCAVVMLMTLFLLGLNIDGLPTFMLTLVLSSITFLLVIVALARAFGDVGKAATLLLLILQLSSAGGVIPVELSGGIYQAVSPWLPFTWVIKALRASMFGAFDNGWLIPWLALGLISTLAWLMACYSGSWTLVKPDEYRPAIET